MTGRAPQPRPRPRSFGLTFGTLPTGPNNAVTDVPGVRVGHVTLFHGDHAAGDPVARTGVTAIVPDSVAGMFERPMPAAFAVLNGAGELTGSVEIAEWGILETPVLLTSTNNTGRISDGVVDELLATGVRDVVVPVVGECDDSWLDDVRRRWVTPQHAREAIATAADGPVAEGVVGAGTGMTTMGWKGGIGTSSRVVEGFGTVGVLLLCNFGGRALLRLGGRPVGETLHAEALTGEPDDARAADTAHVAPPCDTGGSCLGVVFTDIPLDARQLRRVATRVGLGLARVGSVAHHGSGDIFLAVSTANRVGRDTTGLLQHTLLADQSLNEVFTAVVDASEEAVTNALFVADTVTGVDGNVVRGLPVQRVLQLLGLPTN
jgi:D-aminopeptidase